MDERTLSWWKTRVHRSKGVKVVIDSNGCRTERDVIQTVLFCDCIRSVHNDMYSPGHCIRWNATIFLKNLGQQHLNSAVRVIRYLKTTHQHRIIYQYGYGSVTAEAYSYAYWGTNLDDRRSVLGVMVSIGKAPVLYKSKFQRTVCPQLRGS